MLLLAALLPAALVLAACGGGDSSGATPDGGTTAQPPPATDETLVTVDSQVTTCEQMAQLPDCEGLQQVFDDYGHNLQAFLDNGELGSFGRGYTNTTTPIAGLIACQHLHSGADNPQVAFSEQLEGAGFPQTRAEMLDLINSAGEHLCPPDDDDTTGSGDEASP